jgi:hypothetical protein
MKILFLIMIFLVGSVLGGFVMHVLDSPLWDDEPYASYQKINFPESNSNIYASARVWGLTGDHEEVRICSAPIDFKKSVDGECIKFFTNKVFYRREHPNRLNIYVASSSVPKDELDHLGQVSVAVHEVRDYVDLENNYDKQGLTMIAAP